MSKTLQTIATLTTLLNNDLDTKLKTLVTNLDYTEEYTKYVNSCNDEIKNLLALLKHIPSYINIVNINNETIAKYNNDCENLVIYNITKDELINKLNTVITKIGDVSKAIINISNDKRLTVKQMKMGKNILYEFRSNDVQLKIEKNELMDIITNNDINIKYYLSNTEILTTLAKLLFVIQ